MQNDTRKTLRDCESYAKGELHASEDVVQRGLSGARETAAKFLAWTAPGEESGFYAAGYVDELLWLASIGQVFVRHYPTVIAKTTSRAPSRLDEQCAAGMRSRERSYG